MTAETTKYTAQAYCGKLVRPMKAIGYRCGSPLIGRDMTHNMIQAVGHFYKVTPGLAQRIYLQKSEVWNCGHN